MELRNTTLALLSGTALLFAASDAAAVPGGDGAQKGVPPEALLEVLPRRLWVSGAVTHPLHVEHLHSLGARAIISLMTSQDEAMRGLHTGNRMGELLTAVAQFDMQREVHPLPEEPTLTQLQQIATRIELHIENGRPVALHCSAGQVRSPTAAAHYLVQARGYSAEQVKRIDARFAGLPPRVFARIATPAHSAPSTR